MISHRAEEDHRQDVKLRKELFLAKQQSNIIVFDLNI